MAGAVDGHRTRNWHWLRLVMRMGLRLNMAKDTPRTEDWYMAGAGMNMGLRRL